VAGDQDRPPAPLLDCGNCVQSLRRALLGRPAGHFEIKVKPTAAAPPCSIIRRSACRQEPTHAEVLAAWPAALHHAQEASAKGAPGAVRWLRPRTGTALTPRSSALVAPDERKAEVRAQVARPAFRRVADLQIRYLPYSELENHREAMARFGSGLKPIEAAAPPLP